MVGDVGHDLDPDTHRAMTDGVAAGEDESCQRPDSSVDDLMVGLRRAAAADRQPHRGGVYADRVEAADGASRTREA